MSKSNNDPSPKFYACPKCQQPAATGTKEFPFCSKRCKTIDLGAWANEEYTVSTPLSSDDKEDETAN